jgi:hypothetical protein
LNHNQSIEIKKLNMTINKLEIEISKFKNYNIEAEHKLNEQLRLVFFFIYFRLLIFFFVYYYYFFFDKHLFIFVITIFFCILLII